MEKKQVLLLALEFSQFDVMWYQHMHECKKKHQMSPFLEQYGSKPETKTKGNLI